MGTTALGRRTRPLCCALRALLQSHLAGTCAPPGASWALRKGVASPHHVSAPVLSAPVGAWPVGTQSCPLCWAQWDRGLQEDTGGSQTHLSSPWYGTGQVTQTKDAEVLRAHGILTCAGSGLRPAAGLGEKLGSAQWPQARVVPSGPDKGDQGASGTPGRGGSAFSRTKGFLVALRGGGE